MMEFGQSIARAVKHKLTECEPPSLNLTTLTTKRSKNISSIRYDPSKPIPKSKLTTIPYIKSLDEGNHSKWSVLTTEEEYKPIQLFKDEKGLFGHHFDTYEHFVSEGMRGIIDDESLLVIQNAGDDHAGFSVNFSSVNITRPFRILNGRITPVYPNEMRMSKSSYLSNVTADVTIMNLQDNSIVESVKNRVVCTIPTMLCSSVCNLYNLSHKERIATGEMIDDQGGYFVVGGYDRVLTSQVKRLYNGSVLYEREGRWLCEMRSMNVETGKSVQIIVTTDKQFESRIVVTFNNETYCMMEVFAALGITAERMVDYIGEDVNKHCTTLIRRSTNVDYSELINVVRESKLNQQKIKSIVNWVLNGKKNNGKKINEKSPAIKSIVVAVEQVVAELTKNLKKSTSFSSHNSSVSSSSSLSNEVREFEDSLSEITSVDGELSSLAGCDNENSCDTSTTTNTTNLFIDQDDDTITMGNGEFYHSNGIKSEFAAEITSTVKWALSVTPVKDLSTLFTHIGNHGSNEARAQCLGRMVKKLGTVLSGKNSIDDRSDYANKRIESAGTLISDLFKMLWKQFLADIKLEGVMAWANTIPGIERDFNRCFINGMWGAKNSTFKLTGVVETTTVQESFQIQTCTLRKVKIYVNHENKNLKIRELHPSSEYSLCISETVEGQDVGTRLGLAICASVSKSQNVVLIKQLVRKVIGSDMKDVMDQGCGNTYVPVIVNGCMVAYTTNYKRTIENVRKLRQRGAIAIDTSVSYDDMTNCIEIWCDVGRLIRPVLNMRVITPDLIKKAKSFSDLLRWNAIVIRDIQELSAEPIVLVRPNEIETYPFANYSEIHPSALYGVLAGSIVYVNHTQSPRACYMTCMARHSMGTRLGLGHFAPQSYTLNMPQKPLVATRLSEICEFSESPNGVNAIVAILSSSGFNQEDSVILNRSSLQRGLFHSTIKRIVTVETRPRTGLTEEICRVPDAIRTHGSNAYRHLDENGLPRVGSYIKKGDVLVGRIATSTSTNGGVIETSAVARLHEDGLVKSVYRTSSKRLKDGRFAGIGIINIEIIDVSLSPTQYDEYHSAKPNGKKIISPISDPPMPEIGDKVCSDMAQKGTCGMVYNMEDMPFTKDGLVPDIIINPHCMPSRMTPNQIMASIAGKAAAMNGVRYDGSPFQLTVDPFADICEALKQAGFEGNGTEIMYDGVTGQQFKTKIFIGSVFYRCLTQLARNNQFSSIKNNVKDRITRQPRNGRINEGGLRVGDMENNCMLVHGVSRFQREKMLDLSDDFKINVCTICKSDGLVYRTSTGEYRCKPRLGEENTCERKAPVVSIRIPAGARQLFHLTGAVNVDAKFEV